MAHDPQLSSRLLCLPFEVLDRIYDMYLAFGFEDFNDTLRPFHVYLDNGEYSTRVPPFVLTCKRVYDEMRDRVHAEAALRVYMMEFSPRLGFAVHGNLRYARLRKLYFIVAMEHANWNRWMPMLEEVLHRTQSLRELVIDWQPRLAQSSGARWEAKMTQRKEEKFFQMFEGLKELQVIRLHGEVPPHWVGALKETTGARLVVTRAKWWKEPGTLW